MNRNFVQVFFDLDCEWELMPPEYRIFVNEELFAERTYTCRNEDYSRELLQVLAPKGVYQFRVEPLQKNIGKFTINNTEIKGKKCLLLDDNTFQIL